MLLRSVFLAFATVLCNTIKQYLRRCLLFGSTDNSFWVLSFRSQQVFELLWSFRSQQGGWGVRCISQGQNCLYKESNRSFSVYNVSVLTWVFWTVQFTVLCFVSLSSVSQTMNPHLIIFWTINCSIDFLNTRVFIQSNYSKKIWKWHFYDLIFILWNRNIF